MAESITKDPKDVEAVAALYKRWKEAWLKLDKEQMVSVFDSDYPELMYLSEENPAGLRTYEEIVAYWDNATKNILTGIPEWREVRPESTIWLTPKLALIYTELATAINTTIMKESIAGGLRCSILVHKKVDGRWAIIHYHESRQLLIEPPAGEGKKWTLRPDATLRTT